MANIVLNATLGANLGEGKYVTSVKLGAPVVAADTTDVADAIAVLVADGASPTQAHVTTLNNAWTTLLASITALNASAADGADLKVTINNSRVTSANAFIALFRAVIERLTGFGLF